MTDGGISVQRTQQQGDMLSIAKRELRARKARTCLKTFIEFCMPDPAAYNDIDRSLYECQPVHEMMINHFVKVVTRDILRGALSVPSQHGKTTIDAEYGLAWVAGNYPYWNIIYGTYSEPRAKIVGDKVRRIMESPRFREVFPEFELRKGSKAKDLIGFTEGGSIMFLGRNSGGAGNPCDLFVIDDPYKNMMEAKSKQIRAEVWSWYTSVVEQRCPAWTPIVIIHTRWSDDDLIGRLCDPEHPDYDPEDNDQFEYLKLPGVIYEDQHELVQGLKIELCSEADAERYKLPCRAGTLWPRRRKKQKDGSQAIVEHWPLKTFMGMRRKNPSTFSAMVMSKPTPPEGDFYKRHMIKPYRRRELPAALRYYAASDHAVGTLRRNDPTCIGIAGVDADGNIWIMPDLVWEKIETPTQVDKTLKLWKKFRPLRHYAEGDHIKKAIGPFLKKQARAEGIFTTVIEELPKQGDKLQKSQSINAMADLGMLRLPVDAPWYEDAVAQMLRFDGSEGRPDDFCDMLANLGRGLDKMLNAPAAKPPEVEPAISGTIGWVKFRSRQESRRKKKEKALAGW